MALVEYYGEECPHCKKMDPLIAQLEEELDVEVEKLETWHRPENEEKRKAHDKDNACGGVPFFINTDTDKTICGEVGYEELKAWAKGE